MDENSIFSDDMKTVSNDDIKTIFNDTNSDDMKTVCNDATKMPMFQQRNFDSLEALAFDSMIVDAQPLDSNSNPTSNSDSNPTSDSDSKPKSSDLNSLHNLTKEEMTKTIQENARNVKPVKTLPPGTIINSTYQIVRKIAQGGMGVVYEGFDLNIQRRVAIKMILATLGGSKYQTVLQRFINEIHATAQLSHRNIVHIYASGLYQKQPYLVMEYIEGQSINQYVAKNCLSDWKKIAELIYKIAKGLAYIHQHNFLHRDIKPANILVTEEGEPILIDFGIVKDKNLTIELTRQGKLLGTLQYMPLEQAKGNNKDVDCRSDVYSLGIVLYELLTQKPAYSGTNYDIFQKILHEEPTLPRKINPEIPVALQRITLHAIAKDKNDRYQTASIFAQALGHYLYPQEIKAPVEERKIQWHFSSNWNLKKKYQYFKKLDQKRKKRPAYLGKEDSFLKKVIWSIILFIAILSLLIFAYYHFFIEKNYVIFQKEDAKKIDNFTYDHTIKYKHIKDTLSEFDVYNYNLIPEMSFIYIPDLLHGNYLLATEDCKQSTWLSLMCTTPWESELLQAKKDILCDYYNVLPETIKNDVQYKDNQDSIAPDKPAIWIDLYDCQEFCHRTYLTLMTKAQWEHAKKLEPFKNLTENYYYGINIKTEENKEDIKLYATFRCAYLIDSAQKEISSIPPTIQKQEDIQGFTCLGIKRFSLEQEAKSIPQYMHKKSHIIFSLVTQEQENGSISNFLMSERPCHYKNLDYIMNTHTQEKDDPYNRAWGKEITLKECKEFLEKSGLSLPTYSQWQYTCTEKIDQSFLRNQWGIYIFESETVFCRIQDEVYFGIKKKTYENEQEVTAEPISDYEESSSAYLRLVYNLP